MLNLTVTTLKGGRETLLHRVEVVNDQTGTPEVGHYRVRVTGPGRPVEVRVEGHARADGALRLAYEALGAYLRATAPPNPLFDQLTLRQREVAGLLCEGLSNKQIARRLDLHPDTVKTHLRHLYRHFDVHSRAQLALRLGRASTPPGASCPPP